MVSRELSQVSEPSQERAEPPILLPRPNTVTLEERAVLSEVALPSGREELEPDGTIGLFEDESAACVAAPTLVSLSETTDESITTMESLIDSVETPSWSSSAQTASLTITLTALILAGIPVANTTLDNVLKSLRKVVTATTTSLGAEVESP